MHCKLQSSKKIQSKKRGIFFREKSIEIILIKHNAYNSNKREYIIMLRDEMLLNRAPHVQISEGLENDRVVLRGVQQEVAPEEAVQIAVSEPPPCHDHLHHRPPEIPVRIAGLLHHRNPAVHLHGRGVLFLLDLVLDHTAVAVVIIL